MNLQAEPLHLKEATVTCIPRLRGGGGGGRRSRSRGGGGSAAAAQQVSVLDRVRDVVLRLAMLSAASSSATTTSATNKKQGTTTLLRRTGTKTTPSTRSESEARVSPASLSAPYAADSYRSEAVDDCIQFLKRSAAGGGPSATAEEEAPLQHAPPPPAAACAAPCDEP
ncbi:hypothetical protein PR202_gb27390 [Eleusine coracana subsp. coracana]|uniref:Josephin-like protein n=1 Tax=Eleusine coracana subsp. coracana TaxID=191504 RepID=A0AAV5FUV9_ELECO|nr:hypothetical protein QOZ80_4BG0359570 [Eleusine coracana subsp. coracana]GJN38355.1 hypothetical protein PR202_gb27390 [Eleusine coracana subsp. coracana]